MEITEAELKAKIKDAVELATADATEGLKAKNSELLGKLKKAQKGATIDPAEHAELQSELDDTQTKLAAATKALKTAGMETEKHKAASETASKTIYELLVDNGLSDALLSVGVKNPVFQEAAKALLAKEKFDFEGDGAGRIAKIGDKSLSEFVKTWSESDKGKAFVDAPGNSGGGAPGGEGKLNADSMSKISDPASRLKAINEKGASA